MLAVFTDELAKASTELHDHLENQAALIAPELSSHLVFTFDSVTQNVLSQLEATFRVGRDWLEAKERYTRRKDFAEFQEKQPITPAEGRKAVKIYQQFGSDWEQEKLLVINGAVGLAALCHPKFAAAVQQLRETANLTKEFVKNLVKEVRDAARAERKKKQQTDPGSGWRQDPSGGGRHYQLPPMYNEEAAMKVEALATERGMRAIAVVEEAITAYGETARSVGGGRFHSHSHSSLLNTGFPSQATTANPKSEQPTANELRRQHQEELQAVVSEVRDEHIQMQRKVIERDARIAELEQLVQTLSSPDSSPEPVDVNVKGEKSPYDGDIAYWSERNSKLYDVNTSKALKRQNHTCGYCGLKMFSDEKVHLHHVDENHSNGNKNNLLAIHQSCHDYIHMSKSAHLRTSGAGCG